MTDTTLFFSTRPAYPWSVYPVGLPALVVVAVLLVAFTVWTYVGHPQASRRRVALILALRLLALAVVLLTAVRPSVGVQEDPKVPSVLLVGVDLSESMSVKDEVNNQARADAVRRVLDRCRPTLDELADDQNVTVVAYQFSTPDFGPDASRYDPKAPADGKRSDYGTYLNKTFEKWQGERFVRGHLLVGDGADNGAAFAAVGEAARWGRRGWPVTTFTVGSENTSSNARDLAVVAVSCDPSPVPVKNDVTVTARVHAYGFAGTRVKARVYFNNELAAAEEVTLAREKDNEVRLTTKAPGAPGEVKVRVEVGRDAGDKVEPLPGEVTGVNNTSETYLTVTKEGVRVLVIDRLRPENARLLDALRAEKRFDVYAVWRQTTLPPTPDEVRWLDLEAQAYDVVLIGNVSYDQLATALPDRSLPDKILDRVTARGMGLMFLGGEAAYTGYPRPKTADPKRKLEFADLPPVTAAPGEIVETISPVTKQPTPVYQTVPTARGFDDRVVLIDRDPDQARRLWDQLNGTTNRRLYRLTGYNKLTANPAAAVYAWASKETAAEPAGEVYPPRNRGAAPPPDPLLVGTQFGTGKNGRVLAFGGYDTYLWERLGQPKTNQGVEIHNRFWRQTVLWLAHQEEEEGQVYARPDFRRLGVGGDQTIWAGLKSPSGGDDPTAELEVKVLPPGQGTPEDEDKAPRQTVLKATRDGKPQSKVLFKPTVAGEYKVVVTAPAKDKDGKPIAGPDGKPLKYRGTAHFLAFPDVSDEMLRVAADPAFMEKIAAASGGKALRLEDLPDFLKELKSQPLSQALRPKPRYLPDWRRNHSHGFLPTWLALFTALLGVEWGLRRLWGMV